ncbi:hypothetical protein Syun_015202 [Stephania yunnanensis]|uniref:RRM domain-containing protein n=1 Tax=Stephania yunnanensis TaxID=152371 RepID=A0AAP0JN24_9MAGN
MDNECTAVDGGLLKPRCSGGYDDEVPYFVEIKRTIPKGSVRSKDFKTKKIFVGGVPTTALEGIINTLASRRVQELLLQARESGGTSIIRDHNTNRSRGFGFIVFDHEHVDDLLANGNMIDMVGPGLRLSEVGLVGTEGIVEASELGGGYGGFGGKVA